ncbi:MAG: hypothetical protein ACRESY_10960 [Steroidobacteraceae bacterium]
MSTLVAACRSMRRRCPIEQIGPVEAHTLPELLAPREAAANRG